MSRNVVREKCRVAPGCLGSATRLEDHGIRFVRYRLADEVDHLHVMWSGDIAIDVFAESEWVSSSEFPEGQLVERRLLVRRQSVQAC